MTVTVKSLRLPLAVGALTAAVAVPAAAASTPSGVTSHAASSAASRASTTWSGSWATSQSAAISVGPWENETLRMVARTSLGGNQIRIDLSNPHVSTAATFGRVTVGVQENGATTTATPVDVTFGGSPAVAVPAGGEVFSDPVALPVTAGTRLLVSLYVPAADPISTAPTHQYALETEYNDAVGDASADQFFQN